jgi:FtsP/CotA-like multicopper oxidase with cupredoxin domain
VAYKENKELTMHTKLRHMLSRGALVVVLVAALGIGGLGLGAAQAASLPASPCVETTPGQRTCELWATTGTLTLPDAAVVPVWGYSDTAVGAAQVPGPALIVNQGDVVTIILHNGLSEATALQVTGQAMLPDLVGVPAGGTATYVFTASNPGTYLYEAGLLSNAQHQVAMGLYGALVVHSTAVPATGFVGQAYADPATAFTDEALVVLGTIDPGLNTNPVPAAFDMRDYRPAYYLINGQAYSNTQEITATFGVTSTVLLRYINADIDYHSMALLGLDQTVIAHNAFPLAHPLGVTAETIGPGQTSDVLVTVPATAPQGSKFPLYDGNLLFHNGGAAGYGGMLTFLSLPPAPPVGPDLTGPDTQSVSAAPNPTTGTAGALLTATVSDVTTGGANVQAAEYYIDATTGVGTAMAGTFGSPTAAVTANLSSATLGALASGNHTLYVRGQDSLGNWGAFNFVVLNLDKTGPASTGLALTPNPTNGTVTVALHATGDDRQTGNGTVVAAEYFIGATGTNGSGIALTVTPGDQVASLDTTILTTTTSLMAQGAYTVSVHTLDALGNWGAFATTVLKLDKTGPTTGGAAAMPNPNNGKLGVNSTTPVVRVTATITDPLMSSVQSNVASVEGFIDTAGINGSGFLFEPTDGVFNSPVEAAYSDIPLTTINGLATGAHTLYVHGKDTSGNWGTFATVTLIIDKVGPVVSALAAVPNPTNTGASSNISFALSGTAADPVVPGTGAGLAVTAAEWFYGADPGVGNGTPMTGVFGTPTVNISATVNFVTLGWTAGNHTLLVRAKDTAGNWGTPASIVVNVVRPNNIFANGFDAGNFAAWTTATNVVVGNAIGINVQAAAAQAGGFGMRARIQGNTPGYVTDGTPNLENSYHARFYFNPRGTTTGNAGPTLTIFSGQNAAGTTFFQVQYQRLNAGSYRVRLSVLHAGGTPTTNWYPIAGNAWNAIEIAWQSGTNASASLYTGGTLRQTLTGLNTSAYLLDGVRLGPSTGFVNTSVGTMYFDSFVSTRNSVIGP